MISGFSWARRFSSWWKLDFSSDSPRSPLNGNACRAKYRMLDQIESKIFLFLLFSNACRSDSKSLISPITVPGAVTYLATSSICESDDSCVWYPFFFSIFPVRKSIFLQTLGLHQMKFAFRSEVLSSKYGNKSISSLVMIQQLKSFKPRCLKWSIGWILTPGCYGLSDTLTKT